MSTRTSSVGSAARSPRNPAAAAGEVHRHGQGSLRAETPASAPQSARAARGPSGGVCWATEQILEDARLALCEPSAPGRVAEEAVPELQLDLSTFRTCLGEDAVSTRVQQDRAEARKFQITSTPTFLPGTRDTGGQGTRYQAHPWSGSGTSVRGRNRSGVAKDESIVRCGLPLVPQARGSAREGGSDETANGAQRGPFGLYVSGPCLRTCVRRAAEAQCSQWSCGTCNTTTFYDCDSSGGPPFVYAYQLSGCDTGNQEMCGDNELACISWCTSLEFEEQVDDCLTPQRRCHIGYPGSSACDEMAGTMDCTCGWFNMYCDW